MLGLNFTDISLMKGIIIIPISVSDKEQKNGDLLIEKQFLTRTLVFYGG